MSSCDWFFSVSLRKREFLHGVSPQTVFAYPFHHAKPTSVTYNQCCADLIADNSTMLESELQTTLNDISGQLQTGEFGIVQDGMIVQPDKDSISMSAWDMCPVGYVESDQEGFCGKF